MTHSQWADSIYGMFGRNCIVDSLQELVIDKLIKRESYRISDRESYKYLLNAEEINIQLATMSDESRSTIDSLSAKIYESIAPDILSNIQKTLKPIPSYAEYLQSPEWKVRRKKALQFAGYRCQICNSKEELNVHHRSYERIGHEHMGDLVTLCKNCHEIFHNNGEL